MATTTQPPTTPDSRDILECAVTHAYDKAKRWAGAVTLLQGGLFVVGVVAIFSPAITTSYPWFALPLALLGGWLSSQVGRYKGIAEDAKRRHELLMGFGIEPAPEWLADLRLSLPKTLKVEFESLLREGITYDSRQPTGPVRVLENLIESAWFSKHLAGWCSSALAGVFTISIVTAASLLLYCAIEISGNQLGIATARAVAATILFLISVGMLRGWTAYASFSRKAERVDEATTRLLRSSRRLDRFDALQLLGEYQLARAAAPLIPTWVWKFQRNSLNQNWKIKKPL